VSEPSPAPYAGLVTRATAFVLDVLLLSGALAVGGTVVGVVMSMLVPGDSQFDGGVVIAAVAGSTLALAAYLVLFWTLAGQTPGMRFMGLRVERLGGGLLSPGRALARVAGMVLAALPLGAGYALILFDEHRQGLQDKLADTAVLYAAETELPPASAPSA
jgi:uncharacterized RDD family membrane protein YckC